MTLRQEYACMFMQAILQGNPYWEEDSLTINKRVEGSFRHADAMIAFEQASSSKEKASENDTPENKNKQT